LHDPQMTCVLEIYVIVVLFDLIYIRIRLCTVIAHMNVHVSNS